MKDKRKTNREAKRLRCKDRIVSVCVQSLKQRVINEIKYNEREIRLSWKQRRYKEMYDKGINGLDALKSISVRLKQVR